MDKKIQISKIILQTLIKKQAFSEKELYESIENSLKNEKINKKTLTLMLKRAIKNLEKDEYLESFSFENTQIIRITKKGKNKILQENLGKKQSLMNSSWDGKWRIVVIDFPEKKKNERQAFRYLLQKAGFIMLKNSVWVSPFPYEYFFNTLKNDMGLNKEISIFTTNDIDESTKEMLCNSFSLF
jgi:DNA-binding transcriptional regulator PaaX